MTNTLNSLILIPALLLFACNHELGDKNDHELLDNPSTEKTNMNQNISSPYLFRTYFGEGIDWNELSRNLISKYDMGFSANFTMINDKQNQNKTPDQIIKNLPEDYPFGVIFVADSLTFNDRENTVLCIDVLEEPGKSFRVIVSELWGVENNLSIANMDFYEFYESCDENGIFRGFK